MKQPGGFFFKNIVFSHVMDNVFFIYFSGVAHVWCVFCCSCELEFALFF